MENRSWLISIKWCCPLDILIYTYVRVDEYWGVYTFTLWCLSSFQEVYGKVILRVHIFLKYILEKTLTILCSNQNCMNNDWRLAYKLQDLFLRSIISIIFINNLSQRWTIIHLLIQKEDKSELDSNISLSGWHDEFNSQNIVRKFSCSSN